MTPTTTTHNVQEATTILNYLDVFELSYSVYAAGRSGPNEISPLWMFPFDFEPDTMVFCAYSGMEIIGTITVNKQKILPFEDYFSRQDFTELQNRKVAEISRLIVKETYTNKTALLNELFSWAYVYATKIHATTDFIIEVAKGHANYYENVLGFDFLHQASRPFDSSSEDIVLLRGDLDKVKNNPKKYSFIDLYNKKSNIEKTLRETTEQNRVDNLKVIRNKFYDNYPQPIIEFALPQKKSRRPKT